MLAVAPVMIGCGAVGHWPLALVDEQSRHADSAAAPSATVYVLVGHGVQVEAVLAPTAVEYVCLGHSVQLYAPAAAEYDPAGQETHAEEP